MRLVLVVLVFALVAAAAAMLWQHRRYLHVRRDLAQDRQPLLYGGSSFHVLTFLHVRDGEDVIDAVRGLHASTRGLAGVRWVYAGKVALNGNASSQLGEVDWSAVVLLQYPSLEAYEEAARTEGYRRALARFAESYSQGFARSPWINLMIPQGLLVRRMQQVVTREPSSFPFESVAEGELPERARGFLERLRAERALGANAVVVANLVKRGTPAQQAADRGYVGRMMGAMAEGGYGPLHLGRAVRVEGDHDFDAVALVYYPGVDFFADMVRSRFFQGIIDGKQLGDTQASITVPILDRL